MGQSKKATANSKKSPGNSLPKEEKKAAATKTSKQPEKIKEKDQVKNTSTIDPTLTATLDELGTLADEKRKNKIYLLFPRDFLISLEQEKENNLIAKEEMNPGSRVSTENSQSKDETIQQLEENPTATNTDAGMMNNSNYTVEVISDNVDEAESEMTKEGNQVANSGVDDAGSTIELKDSVDKCASRVDDASGNPKEGIKENHMDEEHSSLLTNSAQDTQSDTTNEDKLVVASENETPSASAEVNALEAEMTTQLILDHEHCHLPFTDTVADSLKEGGAPLSSFDENDAYVDDNPSIDDDDTTSTTTEARVIKKLYDETAPESYEEDLDFFNEDDNTESNFSMENNSPIKETDIHKKSLLKDAQQIIKSFMGYSESKKRLKGNLLVFVVFCTIICTIVSVGAFWVQSKAMDKIIVVDNSGELRRIHTEDRTNLYLSLLYSHCEQSAFYMNSFDQFSIDSNYKKALKMCNKIDLDRIRAMFRNQGAYNDAVNRGVCYRYTFKDIVTARANKECGYDVRFWGVLEIIDGNNVKKVRVNSHGETIRVHSKWPDNVTGYFWKSYNETYSLLEETHAKVV